MNLLRRVTACLAAATAAALTVSLTALPAQASSPGVTDPGVIANAVPFAKTPNIGNGAVEAIVQVGTRMVVGGTFTTVTPTAGAGTGTAFTRNYLLAFNASTGELDTGFAPAVNGEVDSIAPTADGTGVYVGGVFTVAGGRTTRLALFNVSTGALVTTFNPSVNGPVKDMALTGGHLLVAGTFTSVGGQAHGGLVSLNPTTGGVESYVNINLTGNHNYGRVAGAAQARVGATSIAVNPAGTRAIVDGNFITATDGGTAYSRDQIVSINLGSAAATIDSGWNTNAYIYACYSGAYDSYVRDIGWSPDGSYFVVVTTGGYYGNSFQACDAAARFDAASTGPTVTPSWVTFTGTDSLYSVAVTTSAIYIGGHQRWLNNPYGQDSPAAGAVPRPGLAALDPANGVPLSWNPGRNTRGHGAEAVYATSSGIWVGSDTDYIGNYYYKHQKIAFFPFAGGAAATGNNAGDPHTVFLAGSTAGANTFTANSFNPATGVGSVAGTQPSTGGGIDWTTVRGAFVLNGRIWYGTSSGQFYYRTWDGANAFGPAQLVDPYNDPYWANVTTGSGQTYRGTATSFYSELPNVTGMFYSNRTIYYTLSGNARLFSRAFSPDTTSSSVVNQVTGGIISPVEVTVSDPNAGGPVNFTDAGGMFLANGSLWYSTRSDGALHQAPWNGATVSGPSTVDTSATGNWAARAVFVSPTAVAPPAAPVANFTSSCTTTACTFDASSSTAPGSTIASYSWSFGDTATATGVTTSHTYAGAGTNTVTLTVTNAAGGTNAISKPVTVTAAPQAVAFVGSAQVAGNATSETVTVPANVLPGNALLLIATGANGSAMTAPAGWTQVDTSTATAITSTLWRKVAVSGDAGSAVTVSFPSVYKGTVQLLAYSGTNTTNPIVAYAKKLTSAAASSYVTPTSTVPLAGDYVVSVWTTKSSTVNTWTAPAGQTVRSTAYGTAAGRINSLASDGGAAAAGPAGGLTATTDVAGSAFATWTIVLG
jgi:PKD repeat protein